MMKKIITKNPKTIPQALLVSSFLDSDFISQPD